MKLRGPSIAVLVLALALVTPALGAVSPDEVTLDWYLPEVASYDPDVPQPSTVLGHEVGEWHVEPESLMRYFEALAEASDRVAVEEIGRTHERRPQMIATITSPANHARLDEILAAHRALSEPGTTEANASVSELPVVVYLGYSIHGNEPSGSNAAPLVGYHLAASDEPEVRRFLDEAVILLDPSLNPDGLARFAQWANMYRGSRAVADPAHREHDEAWPGGRTNHYWFDLNRDWLLLQHPESRNRVAVFQRWRPNVLADFHEMGTSATYFFQPGVPSRQNPLTPARSLELTREIAEYHARALDEIGSLYYTEESFDDFYYGKGSTYPDVQGSIGILFEQASARGHVQEAPDGLLTFPFAIRNQLAASLSTLRAAVDKREELLAYQRDFFADSLAEARGAAAAGYVVSAAGDRARLAEMATILDQHGIAVHDLARAVESDGVTYRPGEAIYVPLAQRQARLVEAVFERRTEFEDNTFYDVSAWTLPLAFGLPYGQVSDGSLAGRRLGGDELSVPAARFQRASGDRPPVAYAFDWTGFYAPRTLGRLLDAGIRARVATRPLTADLADGSTRTSKEMGYGTVVVPLGIQPDLRTEIERLLARGAREDGTAVWSLSSGLTPEGIDLGSPSLERLESPEILLVVGDGFSSYDAGEIWHLLDHRLGLRVSLVDSSRIGRVDLDRYSHVILVSGWWPNLPGWGEETAGRLGGWVRRGGTLVTLDRAAVWAEDNLLGYAAEDGDLPAFSEAAVVDGETSTFDESDDLDDIDGEDAAESKGPYRSYADFQDDAAIPLVSGTIFQAELDTTHPLAYGYQRDTLPLFRTSTTTLRPAEDRYSTPVRYTAEPLLAGYVSPENLENLSGTPAVIATRLGGGVVIRFADAPTFRAVWYGSAKLVANAIFFGPVIEGTELPEGVRAPQGMR